MNNIEIFGLFFFNETYNNKTIQYNSESLSSHEKLRLEIAPGKIGRK